MFSKKVIILWIIIFGGIAIFLETQNGLVFDILLWIFTILCGLSIYQLYLRLK